MDGLVDAALRFDPSRGVTFATFARVRVRGAMIDALRRLRREAFLARPAAALLAGATPPSVDEETIDRQALAPLGPALSGLEPRERLVLDSIYGGGRNLRSAGAELGLSKSWTCRVHARALDRLRAALAIAA
jgi:RNA polymerase sigma factor for flagellar operon FliA